MRYKIKNPTDAGTSAGRKKQTTNNTHKLPLSDHHYNKLTTEHGLSEATIKEAGLYTANATELNKLLKRSDITSSGIVIPYGRKLSRVRLDEPLKTAKGKDRKYLAPSGSLIELYIPNIVETKLKDSSVPLCITEGEFKALKLNEEGFLCIGLSGVWGFSRDKKLLPDFDNIELVDRHIIIILDSDAITETYGGNHLVLKAGVRLAEELVKRKAIVCLGVLPEIDSLNKTGADDFIVTRGVDAFKEWIGELKPIENTNLLFLETLLTYIPTDTLREQLPFKIKPLIKELAGLEDGIGENYLSSRVKEYFGLTAKERDNHIKVLKGAKKKTKEIKRRANDESARSYFVDEEGYTCRLTQKDGYPIPVRLANIVARIEKQIIEDDGLIEKRLYLISGKKQDVSLSLIEVPASYFSSMNWLCKWGAGVIIEPSHSSKDYFRHEIQVNSNPETEIVYTHTGWRKKGNAWIYLTASGAIGDENVKVKLPKELERYALPLAPVNEKEAITTSLEFIDIGKKSITIPLLSLVYLSSLTSLIKPMPNFVPYLYGPTGTFKTTIAIAGLCHFGEFDPDKLSSFEDTANSLEKRAFILKDVLMLLDDFHPSSRYADAQIKEGIAQRMIRASSNHTGRSRLNSDSTEKGRYEPRGILMITGEEMPSVQSTLARVLLIQIGNGDIEKGKLTTFQQKSALLPYAMSSFIHWVRNDIDNIQKQFAMKFQELRQKAVETGKLNHLKLCEQVAFQQYTINLITDWANQKNVMSNKEVNNLREDAWEVFMENAENLQARLKSEDPVEQLQEILSTLLLQGKITLKQKDTTARTLSANYIGDADSELLGYYDNEYVYFITTALWNSIQKFCRSEGRHFPVKNNTLYRMMREKGLLFTRRRENTTTERICGESRRFLIVKKEFVLSDEKESGDI